MTRIVRLVLLCVVTFGLAACDDAFLNDVGSALAASPYAAPPYDPSLTGDWCVAPDGRVLTGVPPDSPTCHSVGASEFRARSLAQSGRGCVPTYGGELYAC